MKKMNFKTAFNSYDAITLLGEGGAGRVYKVQDENGNINALKCLDPAKASREKLKRFRNEISFCSRNTHKNIVTVTDVGTIMIDGVDSPFYVMSYYPQTLRGLIQSKISPEKGLFYFSQILDGVEAAHLKSIWHRDLKPENVLFDPANDLLVVADFGIAHFSEEFLQTNIATEANSRLANFRYAAPEQRAPGGNVDQRADIYALGLILYEMYTGMLLQGTGHTTIKSIFPDYGYIDDLIDRMLRQQPTDRFTSIDEVKQRLMAYRNDFISRQRISQLSSEVIPSREIDDPLVIDPVRVIDADYNQGTIIFKLNQAPNRQWMKIFAYPHGNFTFQSGRFEPRLFTFEGTLAKIPARDQPSQDHVEMFKRFLQMANSEYAATKAAEQKANEEEERARIRKKIEEEEKRHKFRENLKI